MYEKLYKHGMLKRASAVFFPVFGSNLNTELGGKVWTFHRACELDQKLKSIFKNIQ